MRSAFSGRPFGIPCPRINLGRWSAGASSASSAVRLAQWLRYGRQRNPPAQRREYREQESRGVAIDDHRVDKIDRHPELVELEAGQQREREQYLERDQRDYGRTPHERQAKAVQHDPHQQEDARPDQASLGHDQKDQRCRMQQEYRGKRGNPVVRRLRDAAAKGWSIAEHGHRPAPAGLISGSVVEFWSR